MPPLKTQTVPLKWLIGDVFPIIKYGALKNNVFIHFFSSNFLQKKLKQDEEQRVRSAFRPHQWDDVFESVRMSVNVAWQQHAPTATQVQQLVYVVQAASQEQFGFTRCDDCDAARTKHWIPRDQKVFRGLTVNLVLESKACPGYTFASNTVSVSSPTYAIARPLANQNLSTHAGTFQLDNFCTVFVFGVGSASSSH